MGLRGRLDRLRRRLNTELGGFCQCPAGPAWGPVMVDYRQLLGQVSPNAAERALAVAKAEAEAAVPCGGCGRRRLPALVNVDDWRPQGSRDANYELVTRED
jgi:hypothetical protein